MTDVLLRAMPVRVRQDVVLMFGAWSEQTGLASREQLTESSPSVRAEKRRRRA